ncbi:unnamed protein product [Prorocentrum cordatum]|uniref:RRM domain-containing protein n=1 Tax=Prorocentrum cordatum TaxID=2364126 RepID=A0ABN9UX66_9DINO|nr:unnamed protein product [Polarella glacialis]
MDQFDNVSRVSDKVNRVREWARSVSSTRELTLYVQGIPAECTKSQLMAWINSFGFAGTYDYLYLPRCLRTQKSKGYAFINFVDSETAQRFTEVLGRVSVHPRSSLVVLVSMTQGLVENLARWMRARSRRVRDPEVLPFVAPLEALGVAHPMEAEAHSPSEPDAESSPSGSELPAPRFSTEGEAVSAPPSARTGELGAGRRGTRRSWGSGAPGPRAGAPPGRWTPRLPPVGAAQPAPHEEAASRAQAEAAAAQGLSGGPESDVYFVRLSL